MDFENFDIEKYKNLCNDFFENKPTKDVFEQCLVNLIIEKNKILLNENSNENDKSIKDNKELMEYINKIIENIHSYLSIARK